VRARSERERQESEARIEANPKAYPRAYRALCALRARQRAFEDRRKEWRDWVYRGVTPKPRDRAINLTLRDASPGTPEFIRAILSRIVDTVGWRRAPKLLDVHVNALTSAVVVGRDDVISWSHIRKRLTAIYQTCWAFRPWRELTKPRYVYDASEDEIVLRPLATFLGIKRVHCMRPTQRVWNAIKSLVKLIRSEVCMWIVERRRPDAHAEYTYYPQCRAESIRMQDARDWQAILDERSRVADMKAREAQENSTPSMSIVHAQ
jgi:hypothetical protein